jgi:hypothetical protein
LKKKQHEGKQVHIRYFGDLDPSGEQIEQSIKDKLTLEPYGLKNIDFKRVGVTNEQRIEFRLIPNTDPDTMNKLKRDTNRFEFMKKYDLEIEDDLFQIEVDALQAIKPTEFKAMVLNCVDELFDEDIYQSNLDNKAITPTFSHINKTALNLLAYLQNRLEEAKG